MKKIIKSLVFIFSFAMLLFLDVSAPKAKTTFALNLPVSSSELFVIIGVTGAVAVLLIVGMVIFLLMERKIKSELEQAGFKEESKGQLREEKRVIAEQKKFEKEEKKALEVKETEIYDNTAAEAKPEEGAISSDGGEFDFDMGQVESTEEEIAPTVLDESEFDIDFEEPIEDTQTVEDEQIGAEKVKEEKPDTDLE